MKTKQKQYQTKKLNRLQRMETKRTPLTTLEIVYLDSYCRDRIRSMESK